MTTTTLSAIIEQIVTVVSGLTPTALPLKPYARAAFDTRGMRNWIPAAGPGAMLRVFELERVGARDTLGIEDPRANFEVAPLMLTVAYPTEPRLYGYSQLHEIEALIENDATQVRDAVRSVSALAGPGHQSSRSFVEALDKGDVRVWFQPISIEAAFFITVTP